ncbi:hypothetical protein H6758_00650 [Candidatus Nomurabacteria bacterium]|nr:hypothetical protein [Candidatus Nomurabacteria bacterium]
MKKFFSFLPLALFSLLLFAPADAIGCPLQEQKAYKSSQSSSVWYVTENCTKRAFKNSKIYFTYFESWSEVQQVTQESLNNVPDDQLGFLPYGPLFDPRYGAVVKTTNDPKIYVVLGKEKHWVESSSAYQQLGYKWDWVEDVDQRMLDKYQTGKSIRIDTSEVGFFNGVGVFSQPYFSLVKKKNDPKVYRIEPDRDDPRRKVLRHIVDADVFADLGFRMDRILEIDSNPVTIVEPGVTLEVNMVDPFVFLPIGQPIRSAGDLYTIDVSQEVERLNKTNYNDDYFTHIEPKYGLTFQFPRDFNFAFVPNFESLFGTRIVFWPSHQTLENSTVSYETIFFNYDEVDQIFDRLSDNGEASSESAGYFNEMKAATLEDIVKEYREVYGITDDSDVVFHENESLGRYALLIVEPGTGIGESQYKTKEVYVTKNDKGWYLFVGNYSQNSPSKPERVLDEIINSVEMGS